MIQPITKDQRLEFDVICDTLLDQTVGHWKMRGHVHPTAILFTPRRHYVLKINMDDLRVEFETLDVLAIQLHACGAVVVFPTLSNVNAGRPAVAVVKRVLGATESRLVDLGTGKTMAYEPPSSLFAAFTKIELQMVN